MPRAKVPPGSSSKRSASSASSWRRPNFSCCATSGRLRPRSCRAAASCAPTPLSVKFAPLQLAVFVRGREAPAQLGGVALLLDALPVLALDAQREPQRLGVGRNHLVEAVDQRARVVDAALVVADLPEAQ